MKRDIRSVLVIYKKSDYHLYIEKKGDPCLSKMASEQDGNIDAFVRSHEENSVALKEVRRVLEKHNIQSDWFYRESFDSISQYDMVLSVGGDGTLLEAARKITDMTPLLGVNSSPSSSVGYLCGTNAEHFEDTFSEMLKGKLPENHLSRIEALCNGKLITPPALNDILYADESPAATSHYLIHNDGLKEKHRSSGVWVSTATGSTAAICSAGGMVMPLRSSSIQFVVRELYQPPNREPMRVRNGYLMKDQELHLTSRNRTAFLYFDGPWITHPIVYDDKIVIRRCKLPLVLCGNVRENYLVSGGD